MFTHILGKGDTVLRVLSDSIKFIRAHINLKLHPSTPGDRARALSDLHVPVHTRFRPLSLILRFLNKFIDRSRSLTVCFSPLPEFFDNISGGLQLENLRGELHQALRVCLQADEGQLRHQLGPQKTLADAPDRSVSRDKTVSPFTRRCKQNPDFRLK